MEKHKADLTWLKATCPICGNKYEYTSLYKPETCGKMLCFIKLNKIEESKIDSI